MAKTFLRQKGNYRNLIAFKKTECIYDITIILPTNIFVSVTVRSTR